MSPWVYESQSGGNKIPSPLHEELCKQAESYARTRPWHPKIQLRLRFKNQFCYVDTVEEGEGRILPLCRLRHFNQHGWSLALFSYSNESYQPCLFPDGKWEGTLEAAFRVCEPFIL